MTQNVKAAKAAAEAMKSKGLIDDAVAAEVKLTNSETAKAALLVKAEEYGAAAVEGDMSQTKLAFLFNQAVRVKVATEEDAKAVYMAYAKGYNAARVSKGKVDIEGVEYVTTGDAIGDVAAGKGAEKTAVSIFRTFGKPAVVGQGLATYDRIRMRRDLIGADDRAQSSMFNAFVAVNRAIVKAADELTFSDADLLEGKMPQVSDDLIDTAITKAGGGKSDAEKLAALVTLVGKLVKTGKYDGLEAVLTAATAASVKASIAVPAQTIVQIATVDGIAA